MLVLRDKKYAFNEADFEYLVINKEDVKSERYAETYDQYGQQHGDILDYCMSNLDGQYWPRLIQALEERWKGVDFSIIAADGTPQDVCEEWEGWESFIEKKDLVKFLEDFKENESFTTVKAYTYWDGSNWRSIIISFDMQECETDYEILEAAEASQILKGIDSLVWYEGADNVTNIGDYVYYRTRYSNDPFICRVNEA